MQSILITQIINERIIFPKDTEKFPTLKPLKPSLLLRRLIEGFAGLCTPATSNKEQDRKYCTLLCSFYKVGQNPFEKSDSAYFSIILSDLPLGTANAWINRKHNYRNICKFTSCKHGKQRWNICTCWCSHSMAYQIL